MNDPEVSVENLRKGMARKQFYLIFMRVNEPMSDPYKTYREDYGELFNDHTRWLYDIEQKGIMFASGPLRDETEWDGSGMCIIRADSRQEAEKIAEGEPFHIAGVRKNSVQGWTMNEGSFSLDIKIMSQEINLN